MASGLSNQPPRLSDHAVIRAVQRMLGVTINLDEHAFGVHFCMQLHLYAAGATRNDIDGMVLTPTVRAAIFAGASRLRLQDGVLIIKNGCVVTILFEDMKKRPPRQKHQDLSRREAHRQNRKQRVRRRRVPA